MSDQPTPLAAGINLRQARPEMHRHTAGVLDSQNSLFLAAFSPAEPGYPESSLLPLGSASQSSSSCFSLAPTILSTLPRFGGTEYFVQSNQTESIGLTA